MRAHLVNATYGVLEYAAYPIGMLLVAPIILRNMGAAQYGIWAVVTAAVSMGSIIASGFGDANIQHVASQRGLGQQDALLRTVRCMIGINLVLGTALALLAWMLTFALSGPGATPAIALSAGVAAIVQITAFAVTRSMMPRNVIAGWGAGALVRLLTLVVYGLLGLLTDIVIRSLEHWALAWRPSILKG